MVPMSLKLTDIPRSFHLPQPNWQTIQAWVDEQVAQPEREQAWWDIAEDWLQTLNHALEGAYRIERSDNLLLLVPKESSHATALLRLGDVAVEAIVSELDDLAFENWLGPLVVLVFEDGGAYYDYIAPFYQEGEFGGSGGSCIRQGFVHVALHPATLEQLQSALAHEIAHAALAHLKLPLWLEEGITQLAEEVARPEWGRFNLDAKTAAELRGYWRERGLADFWWGKGFFLADDGQKFSYLLAQVLFRLLLADDKPSLAEFVHHVHVDDAGETAAQDFLGSGLADLAAKFLGEGEWEPVPPDAASYCRRGILFAFHGQRDRALADLNEGLRVDPKLAEGYVSRGLVLYEIEEYAAATADYQQAIALDPRNVQAHNNLAWIYATCPEAGRRNGQAAVEHALKACESSAYSQWYCLGTLAAAYAESEDFEEARRWCKEALAAAPAEEREDCRERLRLYKDGKPCREAGRLHSLCRPKAKDRSASARPIPIQAIAVAPWEGGIPSTPARSGY